MVPYNADTISMIIDSHCHILPPNFTHRHTELSARDGTYATLFPKATPRLATAEDVIKSTGIAGVDMAVVMGMGWTDAEIAREANDYIISSVNRYPDTLTGYCSVNPAWGADAVSEVERCVACGLRGIGEIHPDSQNFDITDKALLTPLMTAAQRLNLPVLVHASEPVGHYYPGKGRTTPDKLYVFIENFPENVIICAHWGGGLPFYNLMPEVPRTLQNVFFDTAASPFLYHSEIFSRVASLVGIDKILMGTDYPLLSHQRILDQIADSELDPEAKAAILGDNAARLLGLTAK